MASNCRRGINSENQVVRLLNTWAGKKVFQRAGLGQKGQDIVCSWPRWKYQIEVKLQEIHPLAIKGAYDRECRRKGYGLDNLWFFYRYHGRIWVALPIKVIVTLEDYWGVFFHVSIPSAYVHSLYILEAGALFRKLIDPEKVWGEGTT